jgi:hypothetical protein
LYAHMNIIKKEKKKEIHDKNLGEKKKVHLLDY